MMQINWRLFIVNLLPKKLRMATVFGLINALFAPLVYVYNTLVSYHNDISYKLAHTSQVWSIQAVLNDAFDIDERRILITDCGKEAVIILDLDTYLAPVILDLDTYQPVIISNDSAYSGSEYDFIIDVPFLISLSEQYRLRALVDFYKLAGKRYDLIYPTFHGENENNLTQ